MKTRKGAEFYVSMSIGVGLPLLVVGAAICLYGFGMLSLAVDPRLNQHDAWLDYFRRLFTRDGMLLTCPGLLCVVSALTLFLLTARELFRKD